MSKLLLYCSLILICLGSAFGQGTSRSTHPIDGDVHPILENSCGCCGKKPHYDPSPVAPSPPYAWSLFTGQIAVVTQEHQAPGSLMNQVLVIWNLTNESSAPLDSWWQAGSGPTATQYYSDPRWRYQDLGDVFGLTLDNQGNIYVSATNIYGTGAFGSLSTGTTGAQKAGQIYKIATGTGTPIPFGPPLPQDPNIPNGLGNIAWDCGHNGLFATNFYDGLIYRLDASGNQLSTWDHGNNLPSAVDINGVPLGQPAIPTAAKDGLSSYTALGRRPWAVRVHQGRLFYSVWNQDGLRNPGAGPNEIWSVALDSSGNPMAPARLEKKMPSLLNVTYSNPVSDISFTKMGSMLVAERTMLGNSLSGPVWLWAHKSRVLEFNWSAGQWSLTSPTTYLVGYHSSAAGPESSAGGVDSDSSPGGRLWATADYMHFNPNDFIYGIQGLPAGGGNISNSILIDANNDVSQYNKAQIGDVKIPCPDCINPLPPPVISGPPSMCIQSSHYTVTPQAGVTYTWTVTGGTPSITSGPAIDVNWSNNGPGSVKVTATNAEGCAATYTIPVSVCNLNCSYCSRFKTEITIPPPVSLGGGVQSVTPTITSGMPGVTSITETLLNASVAYSPASCGPSGQLNAYLQQASPGTPQFNQPPVLPVANGNQAIWQSSSPTTVSGVSTPFQLHLGPPSGSVGMCRASYSFCMRFSLGDSECKHCDSIKCFGPFPYVSKEWEPRDDPATNPVPPPTLKVLPDGTSVIVPK